MHKASLLSNVTETCPCKRPCPDQQIDWHMVKIIMNLFSIENVDLFPELIVVSLSEYSVIKREF